MSPARESISIIVRVNVNWMTGRCLPVCVEAIERANYATTKNNIRGNVIRNFFDKDVRVAATRVAASIVINIIINDSQDGKILLCVDISSCLRKNGNRPFDIAFYIPSCTSSNAAAIASSDQSAGE